MTMGIYKITNKLNLKSYIGQSIDIERRWCDHIHYANSNKTDDSYYHNKLYNAIRKYGKDNFSFEILEECNREKLSEREIYWIAYYDTFNNGYNLTIGGDVSGYDVQEDKHPNHKLTKNDVIDIRTKYANHERKKDVYELYKNKIGPSGFSKIWKGETWKTTMVEVYTDENKLFHKHNCGLPGQENGRAKLSNEQALELRQRMLNGENIDVVYEDYKHLYTRRYFRNIWYGKNWFKLNE